VLRGRVEQDPDPQARVRQRGSGLDVDGRHRVRDAVMEVARDPLGYRRTMKTTSTTVTRPTATCG
jgi:hypothetical protein